MEMPANMRATLMQGGGGHEGGGSGGGLGGGGGEGSGTGGSGDVHGGDEGGGDGGCGGGGGIARATGREAPAVTGRCYRRPFPALPRDVLPARIYYLG